MNCHSVPFKNSHLAKDGSFALPGINYSVYDSETEDSKSLILFGNPYLDFSFLCGTAPECDESICMLPADDVGIDIESLFTVNENLRTSDLR